MRKGSKIHRVYTLLLEKPMYHHEVKSIIGKDCTTQIRVLMWHKGLVTQLPNGKYEAIKQKQPTITKIEYHDDYSRRKAIYDLICRGLLTNKIRKVIDIETLQLQYDVRYLLRHDLIQKSGSALGSNNLSRYEPTDKQYPDPNGSFPMDTALTLIGVDQ